MNIENRRIREFRIKMAALLILRKVLLAATVWGLLWGTVVIVMRAAMGMPRTTLLAGGIALMLAIGWAVVRRCVSFQVELPREPASTNIVRPVG